ncbi:hypothetical protein F5884DRAFT_752894 [Xylogone sp. PMI_703]|nr:hypothetical protein F5884DRAFT_752894 [Xylogone sp. PMI_703]
MKLSRVLLLALAAEATASSWFSKAVEAPSGHGSVHIRNAQLLWYLLPCSSPNVPPNDIILPLCCLSFEVYHTYNRWHETELERWLSDHNIPYPTPADRRDLENLVKDNWQSKVAAPYNDWDTNQITAFLKQKGAETSNTAAANKDSLINQVKNYWYETEEKAEDAWTNVKDWIFDSWTDSQIKAFADRHGIPVPQPRTRDTVLQKVRSNYETVAKKVGETASYPGDWLYETWSESDLKEWLDTNGFPAPQPTTRDKLIASVRRNSRLASLKMADAQASASKSAAAAYDTVSDALFDSWSDSQLKEWADKNGINVPQGSKRNELLAIVRRHRSKLTGDKNVVSSASSLSDQASSTAASAFGAATSKAGNQAAKATEDAKLKADDAFNAAVEYWSDSRLKAYLDARGVPVPQSGKRDELLAKVRLHKHKAATGWSAWTFDTWTYDNLKDYLASSGNKAAEKASQRADATREDLVRAAQEAYASASKTGGDTYASVTSYLAKQTDAVKDTVFDNWSDSELKAYLDTYGVSTYQGTARNELRAWARNQANYFRYGTTTPQGTLWAKLQENAQWVLDKVNQGAAAAWHQAEVTGEKVSNTIKGNAADATARASEAARKVENDVRQEL